MVILNTQTRTDMEVKYFLEVPNSRCTFCSARDRLTGRSKLYLIFKDRPSIYLRNGIKGTWEQITCEHEQRRIHAFLREAVSNNVPHFKNNRFQSFLN